MKRIEQLIPLSKEHHLSLRLAKQCKDLAAKGAEQEIKAFSQQLKKAFDAQWDEHFKVEEQTIFSLAEEKGKDISAVCQQLNNEHQAMRNMAEQISAGNYGLLQEFGQLLHDHTRLEEQVLFPMVEETFNQQELDNVLKHSKLAVT